jgi:thioredoxin reductase/ferredoxin
MIGYIKKYLHWLHLQWPAGLVEALPVLGDKGETSVAGVWVAGDLTGVPLLKFAADSGKKTVSSILEYLSKQKWDKNKASEVLDIAIIGGGIAGISAGLEARSKNINFKIFESSRTFASIQDFPAGKPIFLYPNSYNPESSLALTGDTKEELLNNLTDDQDTKDLMSSSLVSVKVDRIQKSGSSFIIFDKDGVNIGTASTVLICIGRSGDYRKIHVTGEDLPKVYNRLHDPKIFQGKNVLIVGGGDSALESAIALEKVDARVTLVHRGEVFSKARADNIQLIEKKIQSGAIKSYLNTNITEIREGSVLIEGKDGKSLALKNDVVFSMIGRAAPLDFFRRSKIAIQGEWNSIKIFSLAAILLFCIGIYHWKMDGSLVSEYFRSKGWFPFSLESWRTQYHPNQGFYYILATNLVSPSFYYSFIYTSLIGVFGIRRVAKRPTPYIKLQTLSLFLFQLIPLFLLPFFILPLLGHIGIFNQGIGGWIGDEFFPKVDYGLGREYWRAFGLILAWPLFIWNVFSGGPMWGWLVVSFIQTFVIIPIIVWRWGKGAYCGWICSCGALAETLGDDHRKKMPHGPFWNRLNILGQVILVLAFLLLFARLGSWFFPSLVAIPLSSFFNSFLYGWFPFTYYYMVDLWLAGILGVGLYFHFSGRTWCRFACPLAALMNIYARFTRFRIFSDKKKCISCNICTTVCHQGIDVMSFANKGLPMEDPECVRCSACVVNCPTEVLHFGSLNSNGEQSLDCLRATLQ